MSKGMKREEQNKIMRESYLQTQKEAKEIRERAGINANPILQNSEQYVTKNNNFLATKKSKQTKNRNQKL